MGLPLVSDRTHSAEQAERERLASTYAGMDPVVAVPLIEMDVTRWREARDRRARDEETAAEIRRLWEDASDDERDRFLCIFQSEPVAAREHARARRTGGFFAPGAPSVVPHVLRARGPRGVW